MNSTTVHVTARGGRGMTRARRGALAALPVAAMLLLSSCGTEEPEVSTPSASDPVTTPTDAAPTSAEPEETTEPTSEEPSETTSEEPTTEETTEPSVTSSEPPEEGAGDPATVGLETVQEYAGMVESGDLEGAYGLLSPESMVYFPDVSVFEENGVAGLADDLSQASEPQWAIRSAYEETHDSAQVVSVWGESGDGTPFAYAWAVRKLDGSSWVIDQDITPATGGPRLNWLNPGIQEGVEPWAVNVDQPIMFALLKKAGPNTAVTASIDDGALGSQELTELPTDGAVMYELSDSDISQDGFSVVTASWVAEDDPFVHTSATPAGITRNG